MGAVLALALAVPAEGQVRDRQVRWHQIETDHFILAYHEPLGVLARRAAFLCERAHARVSDVLATETSDKTYVVLSDGTDSANGSATSLPYNTLRIFASAPDDLSSLGDVDDWLHLLITHEHTHVLHLDTIGGLPAILNRVLGKTFAPNLVQPRWFIEGLATHMETRESSAGRLRSSQFKMFMRMDALEDRMMRLDQISNVVDRWPRGNAYYLYGSHFVDWIAEQYGREALTAISHEYGRRLIPYALNRAAQQATGSTFIELYERWQDHQRDLATATRDAVEAQGRVEGIRLTQRGDIARSPRWLDDDTIAYSLFAGGLDGQIRAVSRHGDGEGQELVRISGTAYWSPAPGGDIVYSAVDTSGDIYSLYDLFRRSPNGDVERLTTGFRARDPDVRDGRVVFTQNGAGTTHLMIADLNDVVGTARVLLRNPRFAQVYTPRFSPDGRTVAISRWTRGGYRDIQLVDVASGRVRAITRDRAMDTGPSWTPDGRQLYFSSDRTGITNIYRFTLATGELDQVTNVVSGAFSPSVSPDGERIAYLGYTSYGWDVWQLELANVETRRAPFETTERGAAPPDGEMILPARRYQAWRTLWPRAYLLDYQSTALGFGLGVSLAQTDIAGHYRYSLRVGVGLETGYVDVDGSFVFGRLPTPIRIGGFRRITRRGGLEVGGERQTWVEEALGADVGISYSLPRMLHDETLFASYSLSWLRQHEPFGGRIDPNTPPPVFPTTGRVATLRFGWRYSDVRSRLYDMTPSAGRGITLDVSASHPAIGSEFRSLSLRWSWRRYVAAPWGRNHSFSFRYGGGISGGDFGRRGVFTLGGFPEAPIIDGFINGSSLGGSALRGYPAASRAGTQTHLLQAEYHLPLVRIMAGPATLPVYIRRVHAAIFVDAGNAFFGRLKPEEFRVGVGAELYTDLQLGYVLSFRVRLGIAYGLMDEGGIQGYLHLGSPF